MGVSMTEISTWDMAGHLVKLKEEWETCQVDLSKKPAIKYLRTPKAKLLAEEPKENYGQIDMFTALHQPQKVTGVVTERSKVTITKDDGSIFKYHLTPNAEKGQLTGDYKQISPNSPLAQAMLGKKEGEMFEFGGLGYTILMI